MIEMGLVGYMKAGVPFKLWNISIVVTCEINCVQKKESKFAEYRTKILVQTIAEVCPLQTDAKCIVPNPKFLRLT